MKTKSFSVSFFVRGAVIAALYAVLSISFSPFGAMQLRLSEALTVLPFLFPEAVLGLTVGCVIVNFFSPFGVIDIVFGSLATLIAGSITYLIGKKCPTKIGTYLAPLPSVLANALIVGGILTVMLTNTSDAAPYYVFAGSVGLSQFFSCYILGLPLLLILKRSFKY